MNIKNIFATNREAGMEGILVEEGDIIKKINIDDIYFFTRENSKTYAFLKDGQFEVKESLNHIGIILEKNFIRTHKSYIVNIGKINMIKKNSGNTYNISFMGIESEALATKKSLKAIMEKYPIL